jgi:hypothetical protein
MAFPNAGFTSAPTEETGGLDPRNALDIVRRNGALRIPKRLWFPTSPPAERCGQFRFQPRAEFVHIHQAWQNQRDDDQDTHDNCTNAG